MFLLSLSLSVCVYNPPDDVHDGLWDDELIKSEN